MLKQTTQYLVTVFLVVLFMGFVMNIIGRVYIYFKLENQDISKESRLINITLLPKDMREAAIFLFASKVKKSQNLNKQLICVFGDSQAFGHQVASRYAFHNIMSEIDNNLDSYNFSIVDGHLGDTLNVMKIIERAKLKCNFIFLNLNPSHLHEGVSTEAYLTLNQHSIIRGKNTSFLFHLATTSDFLYFEHLHTLTNKDWFESRYATHKDYMMGIYKEYYRNLDAKTAMPVLGSIIAQARKISDNAIFYSSPHYYVDYNKPPYNYGWDTMPSLLELLDYCKTYPEIHCINWSNNLQKEMFFDLIHMNHKGHRYFANLIVNEIKKITNSNEHSEVS